MLGKSIRPKRKASRRNECAAGRKRGMEKERETKIVRWTERNFVVVEKK